MIQKLIYILFLVLSNTYKNDKIQKQVENNKVCRIYI